MPPGPVILQHQPKDLSRTAVQTNSSTFRQSQSGLGPPRNMKSAALFNQCSNFTITGGTFNQIIEVNGPKIEDYENDFRQIRWGDIYRIKQVGMTSLIERRKNHKGFVHPVVIGHNKVYHVSVQGSTPDSKFTLVEYKGPNFAKWQDEAMESQGMISANVMKLYGVTSSRFMKGLVYHDVLFPLEHLFKLCQSSLVGTWMGSIMAQQFLDSSEYLATELSLSLGSFNFRSYSEWYCPGTGMLQISLSETDWPTSPWLKDRWIGGEMPFVRMHPHMSLEEVSSNITWKELVQGLIAHPIDLLKVVNPPHLHFQLPTTLELGPEASAKIMHLPGLEAEAISPYTWGWDYQSSDNKGRYTVGERQSSGWTRITMEELQRHKERLSDDKCTIHHLDQGCCMAHLSDWAETALVELLKSNSENISAGSRICLLTSICVSVHIGQTFDEFTLSGTFMTNAPKDELYLFINNLQLATDCSMTIPAYGKSYYWSNDPTGNSRLSDDHVASYSLPDLVFVLYVQGVALSPDQCKELRTILTLQGVDMGAFPTPGLDPYTKLDEQSGFRTIILPGAKRESLLEGFKSEMTPDNCRLCNYLNELHLQQTML